MSENSPNNRAWQRLFEKYPIKQMLNSSGVFHITADQIKRFGGREPRLMTKFDSRNHRPNLLLRNRVTILPVTNGEYVLLRGDGYCDVPPPQEVRVYDASKIRDLQTLPWRHGIRGESQVIDTLYTISILRTFANDDDLQLTIRGRLGSRRFSFQFQTEVSRENITVDGVQVEVDSGFEGNGVVILEAKFGRIDNFIVRQLFYPLRDLLAAGITKTITAALLVYSNKVFSLYSFKFDDLELYQSIKLVRQVSYSLDAQKPLPTLADLLSKRTRRPPSGIPFPQADDITKVIDVTELLTAGPSTKEQIADRFRVDPRQGDYYGNAAVWVGLAQKSRHNYELTKEGVEFVPMNRIDRIIWLSQRLCELPVFGEAAAAAAHRAPMDDEEIAKLIARVADLSESTLARRAITTRAWVNWMQQQLRPE